MRTFSLLALLVTLAACDSADPAIEPGPQADVPVVLPLAVGTEWTVARTARIRFDDDGIADTTAADFSQTHTIAVSRDTVVAGETWYRIDSSRGLLHSVFGESAWYANREDGLYRWTASPADAALEYAVGVPDGEPFRETDTFRAVLLDDETTATVGDETVRARLYQRSWFRLDIDETARGPIEPAATSRDVLSPEAGIVSLEVAYAERAEAPDTFRPLTTVRFERTSGSAGDDEARRATTPGIALR